MKEYTKNKNEYFLDGKLYVERIKSCEVEEKLIVLYKHKAGNKYDFVNEIYLKGAVPSHKASWGQSLRGMLHSLRFFHLDSGLRGEYDREKEYDRIFDALYLSAVEQGDELMQLEMKLLNNTVDREECKRLSELIGAYIIPPVKEVIGTDKDGDPIMKEYTVIAETIDRDMLDRSGYNIWHRPYFAMPGSTHANWTIAPTNRYVLDAAKKDKEAVTFQEFLKLIDSGSKGK